MVESIIGWSILRMLRIGNDDEGCEDSRNEPSTQVPPQTPNNNRSRNMGSDKHNVTPGRILITLTQIWQRMSSFVIFWLKFTILPGVTLCLSLRMFLLLLYEAIKILAVNLDYSIREVKVKHRMIAIKYHTDKWDERCCFTKKDRIEMFRGIVNAFDFFLANGFK